MPAGSTSRHTFILVLDGQQAVDQAQQIAQQISASIQGQQAMIQIDDSGIQQADTSVRKLESQLQRMSGQKISLQMPDAQIEAASQAFNTLAQKVGIAQQAVQRAGGEMGAGWAQKWMNAGDVEKYSRALSAAYAQTWGLRRAGYELQARGRGMMMTGTAAFVAAGAAMKEYIDYAYEMEAAARVMDLNSEATELFDKKVRQLAADVTYLDPEEWASGMYTFAAATGVAVETGGELNRTMEKSISMAKLAKLGRVEYGRSVEVTTDILSQYQMSLEEVDRVTAILLRTAMVSKAEVDDLGEAFKFAGARAFAFDETLEETAVTLQVLSGAGLRGSIAGRGYARLLENLISPAKEVKAYMDEVFGPGAFVDAEGKFVGIAQAIEIMADNMSDMTDAEREAGVAFMTTQNAARVLTPLLNLQLEARKRGINALEEELNMLQGVTTAHTEAYAAMKEEIFGYESSTEDAMAMMDRLWDDYTNGVSGRADRMKARWKTALLNIGAATEDILLGPMETISGFMVKVSEFAEKHKDLVTVLLTGAGFTVFVGALLSLASKGIMLYADAKMIATAYMNKKSADENLTAAITFAAAVEQWLIQQGVVAGAQVVGGAVQAAGGGLAGQLIGGATGGTMVAGGRGLFARLFGGGAAGGAATKTGWDAVGAAVGKEVSSTLTKLVGGPVSAAIQIALLDAAQGRVIEEGQAMREALRDMNMTQREMILLLGTKILGVAESTTGVFRTGTGAGGWGQQYWTKPGWEFFMEEATGKSWEDLIDEGIGATQATVEQIEIVRDYLAMWADQYPWIAEEGLNALLKRIEQAKKAGFEIEPPKLEREDVSPLTDAVLSVFEGIQKRMGPPIDSITLRTEGLAVEGYTRISGELGELIGHYEDLGQVLRDRQRDYVEERSRLEEIAKALGINVDAMEGITKTYNIFDEVAGDPWDEIIASGGFAADVLSKIRDALRNTFGEYQTLIPELSGAVSDMDVAFELLARDTPTDLELVSMAVTDYKATVADLEELGGIWSGLDDVQKDYLRSLIEFYSSVEGETRDFVENERKEWFKYWDNFLTIGKHGLSQARGIFSGLVGTMDISEIMEAQQYYSSVLQELTPQLATLSEAELQLWLDLYDQYWQDWAQDHLDYTRDVEQQQKDHMAEMKRINQQAESEMQSIVESILTPTEVTAEDIWSTEMGIYKDKWDENVRRMRLAMQGEEAYKYMIPEDIWGDEAARKRYGENWINNFYAGLYPDQVNWDAFVAEFETRFARLAGQKNLVKIGMDLLKEKGYDPTSADVRAILGLQSPVEQMLFGGKTPSEAGADISEAMKTALEKAGIKPDDLLPISNSVETGIRSGISAYIDERGLVNTLSTSWQADVDTNREPIETVGSMIGMIMWDSMLLEMGGSNFINKIAEEVYTLILMWISAD